ncbi:MAG: PH domain-containing protein [Anaerolineales bacterium]|nr:PH domain-containing protein [Anaerolineales bacterium]
MNDDFIFNIQRPLPSLLRYYWLSSFFWGPVFFIPLVLNSLRYRTIRYEFSTDGITMRWGGLERREVSLAYARIQDIHLRANVLERWLGLARLEVQTASGDAKAEMTLEGLPHPLAVRDFLYNRSRGARHLSAAPVITPTAAEEGTLAQALQDVAAEMRAIRHLLERPAAPQPEAQVPVEAEA